MMLCDELKDYDIMDIEAMDDERLEKSESGKIQVTRVYIKSEADKVIAGLKARTAELEALNHDLCERVTENDEIRLHWEEIEQTRAENERMKARIAELEEERRWRKFPDEKPKKGQNVLFRAKYRTNNVRTWIGEFRNVDFDVFYASAPGWGCEFLPNEIFGWMPLPSAPKEEK